MATTTSKIRVYCANDCGAFLEIWTDDITAFNNAVKTAGWQAISVEDYICPSCTEGKGVIDADG